MLEDLDDAALLQRHADGDAHAFGVLVARHRDRAWAVALRTLGDPTEAADAVQDAFVSAYRTAGSFRGDARFSTWLHRIVVNACLDRARRSRARATVPLDDQPELAAPGDQMADLDTARDIEQALCRLGEDQRIAIVLVDVQGLPVDEAAAVLGVPPGTVKSRCHRGRAQLARSLAHLRPAPEGTPVSPAPSNPVQPDYPNDEATP